MIELCVGHVANEALPIRSTRSRSREIGVGGADDLVLGQLRGDQKIYAAGVIVQTLNSQKVVAGADEIQLVGQIDVFENDGLVVRVRTGGGGIPGGSCWRVPARDFLTIEVSDKAVVLLHLQRHRG